MNRNGKSEVLGNRELQDSRLTAALLLILNIRYHIIPSGYLLLVNPEANIFPEGKYKS